MSQRSLAILLVLTTATLLAQSTHTPDAGPSQKSDPGIPQVTGLPASAAQAMSAVDPERIRSHVRFLASDLLEGRGTGQRGGDIAAEYIATQFALYGLKLAGDNEFPFTAGRL